MKNNIQSDTEELINDLEDQIRSDQSLSRVRLFATPWTAARHASLSITNSQSSLRLPSIESVMPSSHLRALATYFYWCIIIYSFLHLDFL